MNLQENIHRIQSLLTENKEEMIKGVIEKYGLHHAIKLMGGYKPILNVIDHDNYFSNEAKIDFIREVIVELVNKYDDDQTTGISIYELDMSPIRLYEPEEGDNLLQIEYFNPDFVSIDIIGADGINIGGYTRKYDELDDEVIDKIFIFMIDALENNM
jgi:hypothetical protein